MAKSNPSWPLPETPITPANADQLRLLTRWGYGPFAQAALAPDGRERAGDGRARELTGHTGPVAGVAFAPDGQTLASGGADKTVRLWGVADGTLRQRLAHTGKVGGLAWSPDGQLLAVVQRKGVWLWQ